MIPFQVLTEAKVITQGLGITSEFKRRIQRRKHFQEKLANTEHTDYSPEDKSRAEEVIAALGEFLSGNIIAKSQLRPRGNS